MSADSLGDRMKIYESVPRLSLVRRIPVIIRVDGKAFHTLTGKYCEKPHDSAFQTAMWAAAKHLCAALQGAQVAYVQSDEISVLLTDWSSQDAQGWFDYQLQKMVSVAASTASVAFNAVFDSHISQNTLAVFDARAFNLPAFEVNNYFLWRQNDATRNSINCLGQFHFSSKQLHGLNTSQVQELLWQEKKINWNDCPTEQKRGVCVVKKYFDYEATDPRTGETKITQRSAWSVDLDIPVFTQDRNYIERFTVAP